MKIVGLTGNIGSGKSFVANIFANKSIPVYNSDTRAKQLMITNEKIKTALITKFGQEVYIGQELNRKLISGKIFNNKSLLKWMNNLVHPVVQTDFEEWCHTKQDRKYIIKEAAILIESNAYQGCDFIILVSAPGSLRLKRVMNRDNMTESEVMQRMANQMPEEDKMKYANFVIINDGIQVVDRQVNEIHKQLTQNK